MIDSIKDAEYQIISCEMVSNDLGKLFFSPYSMPFGGSGGLEALIKSFGFTITEINNY